MTIRHMLYALWEKINNTKRIDEITVVEDKVMARKQNNVVTVTINNVNSTSLTQRTTVGTLPVGWRPSALVISANVSGNIGYGCVEWNGNVQVYRSDQANQRIDTTLTYIATR